MSALLLSHRRRLMRDPEGTPFFRRALLSIMVAGVVVLLWTGGVLGHAWAWLSTGPDDPHVRIGTQVVLPANPLECEPTPQHRAVITIEQRPDGTASAYCRRYLIARNPRRVGS